jgi:hypothetical protein
MMFDVIDNPVAYTSGWNKGFDAGINFLKEHLQSEEFISQLKEKGVDTSIVNVISSLLEVEE